MGTLIDLTGKRYGYLTVLERAETRRTPSGRPRTFWKCQCDCGNITEVDGSALKHGDIKSCGCMKGIQRQRKGVEYMSVPMPKPLTIQDKLIVGDAIRFNGERLELIGKYNGFGRFRHESGTIECWSWWDVERMMRL